MRRCPHTHPSTHESSPGRTGAVRSEGAGPGRSLERQGTAPAPSRVVPLRDPRSGPEGWSWIQSSAAPAALLRAEDLRARQREGRLPGEASREGRASPLPPTVPVRRTLPGRPHTDFPAARHTAEQQQYFAQEVYPGSCSVTCGQKITL